MHKIQQLRERGILEVECMEELSDFADAIYKHVWKRFASPAPSTSINLDLFQPKHSTDLNRYKPHILCVRGC